MLFRSIAATVAPDRSVPRQADLRGVKAQAAVEREPDGFRIRLQVESPRAIAHLPLALWNLPLVELSRHEGPAEIITVRDGWNGNLHALVVLRDLPRGSSACSLRLWGPAGASRSMEFSVGPVRGRTFPMIEGVRTYLWKTPEAAPCRVLLHVPASAGAGVCVRYNDGAEIRPDGQGRLWVELDEHWKRQAPCLLGAAPEQTGGPVRIGPAVPLPLTSYLRTWQISALQPGAGDLAALKCPEDFAALDMRAIRMPYYTADLYALLRQRPGDTLLFCAGRCDAPPSGRGAILLGYDGPIKVWIDRRMVHHDPEGAGPLVMDAVRVPLALAPGAHEVIVALGSGHGRAAGFTVRFEWPGEQAREADA